MVIGQREGITKIASVFLEPSNPTHRQYEALRAYFVDHLASAQAAKRFGYTPGSFRVLCHAFRKQPDRCFFVTPSKGPTSAPKSTAARQQVIAWRKQNSSVYDIARALAAAGTPLSAAAVAKILRAEGFAKLPRRRDDERPVTTRPSAADVADVRQLDLSPRSFRTRFGGLFLFLPDLVRVRLEEILDEARFPGTKMIPAAAAMRALLGLKLHDGARHSHVMSSVFDEGLALFAGLNAIPKRSFLTEYSCRIAPGGYPKLMAAWCDAMTDLQIERGDSFDCDFHTIPFHGADALLGSITSPSAVGARRASSPSWPKTLTAACSAMPTANSARPTRTTRSCNSCTSGSNAPGASRRSWSSIRS